MVATILVTGASSVMRVSAFAPIEEAPWVDDSSGLSSVSSSDSAWVTSPDRPLYDCSTLSKSSSDMRYNLYGMLSLEDMKLIASIASRLSGSTMPRRRAPSVSPIGTKR